MTYTLIHNPGCSTSRKGLALLQENGVEPTLRKYMNKSEQLSVDELKDIAAKMGDVSPRTFLRDKTAAEFDIPVDLDDAALFQAMADNPKLIQRPIGINGDRAALGRPIDKLLEII